MDFLIIVILILMAFYLIRFFIKASPHTNQTTEVYTGGLGSGKTREGVFRSKRLWKIAYRRWKFRKFFGLLSYEERDKPQLISNIPILVSNKKMLRFVGVGKGDYCLADTGKLFKYDAGFLDIKKGKFIECIGKGDYSFVKRFSVRLLPEHLLFEARIPYASIVFVDEFGHLVPNDAYANPIVRKYLEPFIRLFRQFFEGKLILTDQVFSNIVKPVRSRCNIVYNLEHSHNVFLGFGYKVTFNLIRVSEDVMNVANITEDAKLYFAGIYPLRPLYKSRTFANSYLAKDKNISVKSFNSFDTLYKIDFSRAEEFKQFKDKYDIAEFIAKALDDKWFEASF